MKNEMRESSNILLLVFFLLAGCDRVHIPRLFSPDEVPGDVKEEPLTVRLPAETEGDDQWPRLGDVPFKPKDFVTKEESSRLIETLEKGQMPGASQNGLVPVETQTLPSIDPNHPAYDDGAAQQEGQGRDPDLVPPQFMDYSRSKL
ncbi:MAG: hypothetical protein PHS57_01855 [Alphaproteobacteria bacterium]|nr:hypothetical protein [Alphaproteobacteria bacterium]